MHMCMQVPRIQHAFHIIHAPAAAVNHCGLSTGSKGLCALEQSACEQGADTVRRGKAGFSTQTINCTWIPSCIHAELDWL